MSLLLDTHALLWWLAGVPMANEARTQISRSDVVVVVSAATIWEAAIKRALGKLRLEGSMIDHIANAGFEPLAISADHAERAGALPPYHRDPFDRMLVAQAQVEELTLVTRDDVFQRYAVRIIAS